MRGGEAGNGVSADQRLGERNAEDRWSHLISKVPMKETCHLL